MKKLLTLITFFLTLSITTKAQNTNPYWSIFGNSNASSAAKLGTTNNISLRFYTNDTQRMIINSAEGNVGIGTPSPTTKLQVKTDDAKWGITHTNGIVQMGTYIGSTGGWLATRSNSPLYFATGLLTSNSTAQMTLLPDGNFGVGTSLADYRLSILSDKIETGGNTHVLKISGQNPLVGFHDQNNNGFGYIKAWTNAPTAPFSYGMVIGANPHYPIYFSTNYGATMTISGSNNNVGIGTTTPTTKLEVKTADASWGIIHSNGSVQSGLYTGSNGGWVATKSVNPLYFATGLLAPGGSGTAQMTLITNGNVGINTVHPQYKLSVNGTIQAKEIRVESGWADYVFEGDYYLRPLGEVANYIRENKHLPSIPAVAEIQKSGLAVGAMQTKMMEKIEELTLYVIQLDKKNKELQKEVDLLKK